MVKVILGWLFLIFGLVTEQVPTLLVVQVLVPEIPSLHVPVTVAPETRLWLSLCTVIVIVALHLLPPAGVPEPSTSPTCMVPPGAGVDVVVAVGASFVPPSVGVGVGNGVGVEVEVRAIFGVDVGLGAVVPLT